MNIYKAMSEIQEIVHEALFTKSFRHYGRELFPPESLHLDSNEYYDQIARLVESDMDCILIDTQASVLYHGQSMGNYDRSLYGVFTVDKVLSC